MRNSIKGISFRGYKSQELVLKHMGEDSFNQPFEISLEWQKLKHIVIRAITYLRAQPNVICVTIFQTPLGLLVYPEFVYKPDEGIVNSIRCSHRANEKVVFMTVHYPSTILLVTENQYILSLADINSIEGVPDEYNGVLGLVANVTEKKGDVLWKPEAGK